MQRLIRLFAPPLLLVGLFGCATANHHQVAALSLPYTEFDQAYGDGWRVLLDRGDGLAAVALIEAYLKKHSELTFGQRKFLHLHDAPKGYVIIHSADGTAITASDPQWLDDAVERFLKSARKSNGHWEAPFGLASNYEFNPRSRQGK